MTSADPGVERGAPSPDPGQGAPLVLPGRFRAAVFDMDGLLVDSEPLWVASETELMARHGLELSAQDVAATHGRSIEDTVGVYSRRLGSVDEDALRAELMALMRTHYGAGPRVMPGARELVRALVGRLRLGVASNTDGDLVRLALRGAGLLDAFGAIASGADLGRAKPDPGVYLAACRMLDVNPGDAVAFEDSPAGVQAATRAGLTCIGVPERRGVDLRAAGAHLVVGSLSELLVGISPLA